jgi:hypothetical protein
MKQKKIKKFAFVSVSAKLVKSLYNYLNFFSPGTPVSSTNKTDRHDITEILLKVVLNTKLVKSLYNYLNFFIWNI